MSLTDKAIEAVDERAADWAEDLLDEAADAIRERVPTQYQEAALGALQQLRPHEEGIARAGALGFARLATYVTTGDIREAELEIDRARTREERRVARRRARLAAHSERDARDDVLGGLLEALKAAGKGLSIALPYLLAPALEDLLP